ncbi:RrF2 family transcriptional regulator [Arcticibacter eurypsychrophilus]|uniref:RrF2 family transcriptional regulator n=1 Tax=Arcticibacter eurypsychrophilus TaxID=1434752 RepID=UPI00084D6B77|nr:Rrf2 family transcriptional regulator [Arcticibacter eurypsychrophilus]
MLSYTCKTAIKAVIYLASKSSLGDRAGIKETAEHINASEHTVGKILQTLAKHGIINSLKGPTGGFFITTEQQDQSISVIIDTIEGKDVFKECGLGLSKCSALHPCPIHDEYKVARDLIESLFHNRKIKDLCGPVSSGLTYLIG